MDKYLIRIENGNDGPIPLRVESDGPNPLVINCWGNGPSPTVTFNGRSLNCCGEWSYQFDPALIVIVAGKPETHRAPRAANEEQPKQFTFPWPPDGSIHLAGSGLQIGVIRTMSLAISQIGQWRVDFAPEFYYPTAFWMELYGYVETAQQPVAHIAIPPNDYAPGGSFQSFTGTDPTLIPLLDKFLAWGRCGQGRLLYPYRDPRFPKLGQSPCATRPTA